ncbi:cysteine-rich receptor-like protein kinase 2 isoform X3 [Prosopis cineraria]|uniref:cysteine-rich receptor-like protein kinase 2 isoform X3 n=1 Tax=Prosopis cineraria TaxID=364024 RepID=UPI00241056CD|nr:cysteine-rich receptor-like protein kinase 2 isoform X3 [Prosopis cineraria]
MFQLSNLPFFTFIFWSCCTFNGVVSDPQTNLLKIQCNPFNEFFINNISIFNDNLHATFEDIREQISDQNKHFATSQQQRQGENPVITLFQCRNYLPIIDCVACLDAAAVRIRSCVATIAPGAHVVYDGCFLRYNSNGFFDETTQDFNFASCGNQTAGDQAPTFTKTVRQVLMNLQVATPRIPSFFAATKMNVPNGKAFDAGCFMRYSTNSFFNDSQTIDITPMTKQGSSKKRVIIIGGVVGGAALVLIILALFARIRRRRRNERVPRGDITGASKLEGLVTYNYNDLISATNNFSEVNKLGEGGFGAVYKGTMKNGKVVAVKKLTLQQSRKMEEDFESEVKLISRSKGSLKWKQRYEVILGIARGLTYLHEKFLVRIIHRDIKTNNILLDDDLQPKIVDFGLAKLLLEDKSHLTTRIAGTLGYTAPEYVFHGQLSEKADIYSYGVVVLEIISGQRSNELRLHGNDAGAFLLQKAWKLYEQDKHLELVDETLDPNEYDAEEVKKIIEIGLLCTQASANMRPVMSEIVVLLQNKNSLEKMRPTMPILIETN